MIESAYSSLPTKLKEFLGDQYTIDDIFPLSKMENNNFPKLEVSVLADITEIVSWCESCFNNAWIWSMQFSCYRFWFKTEEQATMFRLTWSQYIIT